MKKIKEISGYLGVDQRELELSLGMYNAPKNLYEAQNMYEILTNLKNKNFLERLSTDWNKLFIFNLNKSNSLKDLKDLSEKIPVFLPATKDLLHKWKVRSKKEMELPYNLRSLKYLHENIYFRLNDWEMKAQIMALWSSETEILLENANTLKDLKYILRYGEPSFRKKVLDKTRVFIN